MICITGAGGTVGSEVTRQLASAKASFRVAHFSKHKVEAAQARGIEAAVIDFKEPETLRAAFQGCDRLFLLGPNVLNQVELELNAIEAAKSAGIQHIVKLSVLGAAEELYSLAAIHRSVEKAIESSGMAWTFLRPNSFMQNSVTFMSPMIQAESAFYSSAGNATISHVDVRDIAAVAIKALTGSSCEGKAYNLTGPEALSYDGIASDLSNALGRPISHVNLSPSDLKGGMLASGMPEAMADQMMDLERYLREGNASLVTDDVKQVTGQASRRYADFVRETAATGVWDAKSGEVSG